MFVSLTLFIAKAQIILYACFRHAIVFLINNRSGMICFYKPVDALMDHTAKTCEGKNEDCISSYSKL